MTVASGAAAPTRRGWPRAIILAGLAIMLAAGAVAAHYTPFWFDPDEGCRLRGICQTPLSRGILEAMWWSEGAGFAFVLFGLASTARRLPSARRNQAALPGLSAHQLARIGVSGTVLSLLCIPVVFLAVFAAPQAGVAVLCCWWLGLTAILGALGHAAAPVSLREWGIGYAGSLLAVAAAVALLRYSTVWFLGPIVAGMALAATGHLRHGPTRPTL